MPIIVVSLDPGITTGWATGIIEDGFMVTDSEQQRWDHSGLWNFLEYKQPNFIVCERFEYRQRQDKAELFSRELIGVVNLYVQQNDVQLFMQMPSEVINGYYNSNMLKSVNAYKPGRPHANDAMSHLLHWFQFKQGYLYNEKGFKVGAPK